LSVRIGVDVPLRGSERRSLYSKRIAHRGVWVEPQLLAEIEYRAKSAEGKVRHPVLKGCGRIYE
jgi:ATP-dependent DNA ligase